MSASDEVAGLPGGQALAALAAQVGAKPGGIRDIAKRWSRAAQDCQTHEAAVKSAVSEVHEDWKGSSADAFAAFMGRFATAGSTAREALYAAAQTLDEVAGALEEAHTSVESICENLLGEVSRLRAANPTAKAADLNARITGLVSEATAAARPEVDAAQRALTQADAALGRDFSMLNRTFSALPRAGARTFVPGPLGWEAAGEGHQSGSLAGTGNVTGSTGGGAPAPPGSGGSSGPPAWTGTPVVTTAQTSGGGGGGGGGGRGLGGGPTYPGGAAPPAQVNSWIDQAVKILEAQGIPASKLSAQDIWIIIQHESAGNPNAINLSDINAQEGHPSIGLMQCIGPTFNAYALPGHGNIRNPVDNIIAGVRYALARYGSLDNVPGVAAVHAGRPYVGY